MRDWIIRLDELPDEGLEYRYEDQEFWTGRMAALGVNARPGRPINARVHVSRQEDSALIDGEIEGSVLLACDRCAERYEYDVLVRFHEYEAVDAAEAGEEPRIASDRGVLTLDIGAVLWEQFVLALPLKPVCAETCLGVCPDCGVNLNEAECSCKQETRDPRLAVFRDLKLK
ncbi:MAG: DUF177 domain-containing protein [Desulfovibrionaceae bacterium]